MKNLILFISGLITAIALQAQEAVNIHHIDHRVTHLPYSTLDSISFNADASEIRFHVAGGVSSYLLTEIDSLTFGEIDPIVTVHYDGTTATVANPLAGQGVEVAVDGADVTVTSTIDDEEVEYRLTGTTSDGSFKLYGQKKFILTLGGVNLTNIDGPAINIQTGKKATVTLADGTVNTLADGTAYIPCGDEDMKGTFFSEGQLIINGTGTLNIQGNYQHGLCSDDYITIDGGIINVDISAATGKGVKCNENLTVNGGTLTVRTTGNTVVTAGDASYCTALKTDANLYLYGGSITTTSNGTAGRGLSADGEIIIGQPDTEGPTLHVTTTGKQLYISGSGMNADYATPKGIKADGDLTVNSGNIYVKCAQDGGEGLESKAIFTINGGTIETETVDDGINAKSQLIINGGHIYCNASGNDGIDSNGTIAINGGLIISSGTTTPEEGFDCDQNRFAITGGILIGMGGATSTPTTSACTQRSLIYNGSSLSGKCICIKDASGNEAFTVQLPVKNSLSSRACLLISTPNLQASTAYTLYTGCTANGEELFHGYFPNATCTGGTQAATFTTNNMVTTIGSSGGGFPGGGGPGRPQW